MNLEAILQWVTVYGPAALSVLLILGIVGLPIPDETLLVFCGYLIFRGTFQPHTTWFAAVGGSIGGITLSFVLGRTLGFELIHRYGARFGATRERMDQMHRWLQGAGHWGLTFGYFVPGVRHFTALVAGATRLEWHIFVAFAWSGAVIWVTTFLCLGYILGEQWRHAAEHAHQLMWLGAIATVVGGLIFWWWSRRKR
ncbi:MAG TPA: DedA family protein [Bryobacteraceae bacterium]|nr:DedA family protein [Bryobacteraceae bacterium]